MSRSIKTVTLLRRCPSALTRDRNMVMRGCRERIVCSGKLPIFRRKLAYIHPTGTSISDKVCARGVQF